MDEFLKLVRNINKNGTIDHNLIPKPKILSEISKNKLEEAIQDTFDTTFIEYIKSKDLHILELEKENKELKQDLKDAIDLIEENNNAFNKTFEDIKNNAKIFYEKKDKEFLELQKENEVYKMAWERFIDFFATKDCEWDAYESGGAIYGDACFHSGHGPHKKYREKYEKEQKDCLDQAKKDLENEKYKI